MKKILIIIIVILLCGCSYEERKVDINNINNFNYDDAKEFEFDIHSQEYMMIKISDLSVLYKKNTEKIIYPASLTKLVTLDTVLNKVENLDDKSYVTRKQIDDLIAEDASLAYIEPDYQYTIEDLLYCLILPSGADAAKALENYFETKNMNLIEEMNIQSSNLGCENSNFVNSTGLHDDNHYTTLDDLFKVIMDILRYIKGREILETIWHITEDGIQLGSSVAPVVIDDGNILGGKTGYTPESGQSIVVLFRKDNRSYLLMLANAMGDRKQKQYWHYEDAIEIINRLY